VVDAARCSATLARIEWRATSVRYPHAAAAALDAFELEVGAGELLALVGESGSGKTTALKCVNRLVSPISGAVFVDGVDVAERDAVELRRSIGYVLQRGALFPHLDVGENIAITPRLLGWPPARVSERVDELLACVGLEPGVYRRRSTRELSGGQAQRVGFARAIAARPSIVLMDEPFGALDALIRAELQEEVARLRRELGLTIVLVTHDLGEALALADRVGVLQRGRLVAQGAPVELARDPGHPYAAALFEAARRHARRMLGPGAAGAA